MTQKSPLAPTPDDGDVQGIAHLPGTTRLAHGPTLPLVPSSPLIGRAAEFEALSSALRQPSNRLITLLGPGGVGKTRLALAVAWEVVDTFSDGIFFIPLGEEKPCSIWRTVAYHIGATRQPGQRWLEAIRITLSARRILLVFDDCEHVCVDLAGLTEVLAACPNITVLVTSQDALHFGIEQEFWLAPLVTPDASGDLGTIRSASAVELFAMHAGRRDPSFSINEHNARDIAAIVDQLDGLPMAIELAAGQIRHLTPAELRHQLEHSLPSLGGNAGTRPERHRSLINMVTWSLSMLSGDDRRIFLRLSILEGDFTPQIAFRIMGLCEVEGWPLLSSFADKSLVKRVVTGRENTTHTPRFFMLKTVHAVARHLLMQDPDEYTTALTNQADAFLAIARDAARHWHGPGEVSILRAMDSNAENILAVLERSSSDNRLVGPALELVDPMFWYWISRNREAMVLPHLERLLGSSMAVIPEQTRGVAHVAAGWFALRLHQLHNAARHFQEATRLIPDPAHPRRLRGRIGEAYLLRVTERDHDGAVAMLKEVSALAVQRADAWYELWAACFALGIHLYTDDRSGEARTHFNQALVISRSHGDSQGTALGLLYLAQIDRALHDHTAAMDKLREALPIFMDAGDAMNLLLGIDLAIMVMTRAGDQEAARKLATDADHLRHYSGLVRTSAEQADIATALRQLFHQPPATAKASTCPTPTVVDLARRVLDWRWPKVGSAQSPAVANLLSERELEILHLVASGKTAPQIAEELFVSPHTVKRHMANIRSKLGVRSQAAAVAMLQRDR